MGITATAIMTGAWVNVAMGEGWCVCTPQDGQAAWVVTESATMPTNTAWHIMEPRIDKAVWLKTGEYLWMRGPAGQKGAVKPDVVPT